MLQRSMVARVAAASVAFTIACKGVGGESHEDPANGSGDTRNWAFTLSVSKQTGFDVKQSTPDTVIATITRTGGFTGPVNLQAFLPGQGITVTIEPITTTGVVTTARVIINVAGTFPPLTGVVVGLAANPVSTEVEPHDLQLTFNVVRKDGTFTNVTPALSIGRGQSATTRVSIIRTNFTAPVPFNIVGAPAGVTATFNPNPVIDTVTQMTLNVDAAVPEGVYNIGVRANEGNGTF